MNSARKTRRWPQDAGGSGNYCCNMSRSDDCQAAEGSAPAALDWSSILMHHERWLRTVVFWRLRDRQAVDDVLQDVALAAVRQAAPLADASRVAPWLYRLAVRHVLLHRRRCGRQRKLLARYESDWLPWSKSAVPQPLDWLLSEERRAAVRAALEVLPVRDSEILLLKYTENWSYQQIAEHLGVSHSAVEARLHRARARLRGELASRITAEVKP